MNFRPFVLFAVFLAFGIISSYFFHFENYVAFTVFILLSISIFAVMIIFRKRFNTNIYLFILLFTIFFLFGYLSFSISVKRYNDADLKDMSYTVCGRITEIEKTDKGNKYLLQDVSISGANSKKLNYKVNLYVTNGNFQIGDIVYYTDFLFDYGETYSQRFSGENISKKIKYYSVVDADVVFIKGHRTTFFEDVKSFIERTLKAGMEDDEYSIAYSLILGDSDVMDEDVISHFRNTGVAHIFAVSGLHIGFLALVLNYIFNKLRLNKFLKIIFTVFILFMYSGICGFTASSIRAVCMSGVLLFANAFGRKYDVLNSVSLAVVIILLLFPMQIFCIGFQLSFSAVFGIVLLSKRLQRILSFMPEKIATAIATSVSAEVTTLPFLLTYFDRVSTISVIINIILIPIVGFVFVLLIFSILLAGIFSLEKIFLLIPSFLIKIIKGAIEFFDRDIFLISLKSFYLAIILFFVILFLISGLINIKLKSNRIFR